MTPPETSRTLSRLILREKNRRALAVLGIAAGGVLSLFGPVFFASIFWITAGWSFDAWFSWPLCFAVAAAVVLPLLFRLEMRTGGEYLTQTAMTANISSAAEAAPGVVMLSSYAGGSTGMIALARTANPRAVSFGVVEIFLAGPRLVVNGFRYRRTDRNFDDVDRERAAEIVTLLLERRVGQCPPNPLGEQCPPNPEGGSGVHPRELLRRGEKLHDEQCPPKELMQPLVWLAHHRWIGVSDSLQRVYLYSEGAKALRR